MAKGIQGNLGRVNSGRALPSAHLKFPLRKCPFCIPVGPFSQNQGFSTLMPLMSGAGFFVAGTVLCM